MLTWEWTIKHAAKIRSDWAGRFWYSFYERGAIMQDFCQRALAYMTGRPLRDFEKLKTVQMKDEIIAHLHARPWLLVLDGLERVLVAYHRIDAAEVLDEEANAPTDKILNRNPCDAIRDEDSDLLRALSACAPSKVLASSRLTPRVLLNSAGQSIPGTKCARLHGLHAPDAEALLRQCGITGSSAAIRDYLQENCDNHPLVVGILGGLIANYLHDRGNFDSWSVDRSGGAALDLSKLNLVQRRNHILHAAISALSDASRQLLSTLALVSESVDYKTLGALGSRMSMGQAEDRHAQISGSITQTRLTETVLDLERRGLLQYDARERRYDLHPVVRGVAAGGINIEEKRRYGMSVVDHFSSLPHSPYAAARTMDDLRAGLHVVRTLLKLGNFSRAASTCGNDLLASLCFNLEAYAEMLSLLRPFFPEGWDQPPNGISASDASSLANYVAIALGYSGEFPRALVAYETALKVDLRARNWQGLISRLRDISANLADQNFLARGLRVIELARNLANAWGGSLERTKINFELFVHRSRTQISQRIETATNAFDLMGRNWRRDEHREGEAEYCLVLSSFWQGTLEEAHLSSSINLARRNGDRTAIRGLIRLRGAWMLEQRKYPEAVSSFQEAVRMARERRLVDAESEAGLALTKFLSGQSTREDAIYEADRLAQFRQPAHRYLALLWLLAGDAGRAQHHVLAAYLWAWADGEPYVNRYELIKTEGLLKQMGLQIPQLSPYNPLRDRLFTWEIQVSEAIKKLRKESKSRKRKSN